jgi:hypothetical protein
MALMLTADEDSDALREELAQFILKHLRRITLNLRRVEALIKMSQEPPTVATVEPTIQKEDVLRAAIVLLHATLEDFLRYVGSAYLPMSNEEVLNRISLLGTPDVFRAEKFFLGKLAQHRGKTIDQVISDSVAASLDKVAFNNTTDISQLLEGAGIQVECVREYYPQLSKLMARRHQIVHRADLNDEAGDGSRPTTPIAASVVTEWNSTVERFISAVVAYKISQDFLPKMKEQAK